MRLGLPVGEMTGRPESLESSEAAADTRAEIEPVPWWLIPNMLSLDAVAIAIGWYVLLAKISRVPQVTPVAIVLGLAVWVVYLADHLLDTKEEPRRDSSVSDPARKQFVRVHKRRVIFAMIALTSLAGFVALRFLRPTIVHLGMWIGALAAIYLSVVGTLPIETRRRWPREAVVALFFALGVCLPVWLQLRTDRIELTITGALLFVLCWQNCCAVETWEWQAAGAPNEGRPGDFTQWITRHLRWNSCAVILIGLFLRWRQLLHPLVLLCVVSASSLTLLVAQVKGNAPVALRCALLDAALCTPLVALLFS